LFENAVVETFKARTIKYLQFLLQDANEVNENEMKKKGQSEPGFVLLMHDSHFL
jgi:hypothetical protein